ncbi:MAG: hypothetical protein KDA61_01640 [Planctomycetales bacterium]|nr:hypothetical protein [Planctomycetales bacterium]
MRFSIRWLLAAVTYAAVVCASVLQPSEAVNALLVVGLLAVLLISAIGSAVCRGARRAFAVGTLIALLISQLALVDELSTPLAPVARAGGAAIKKSLDAVIDNSPIGVNYALQQQLAADGAQGVTVESVEMLSNHRVKANVTRQSRSQPPSGAVIYSLNRAPQLTRAFLSKQALRYHAAFAISLLGGLLGLWFWKREERTSS